MVDLHVEADAILLTSETIVADLLVGHSVAIQGSNHLVEHCEGLSCCDAAYAEWSG